MRVHTCESPRSGAGEQDVRQGGSCAGRGNPAVRRLGARPGPLLRRPAPPLPEPACGRGPPVDRPQRAPHSVVYAQRLLSLGREGLECGLVPGRTCWPRHRVTECPVSLLGPCPCAGAVTAGPGSRRLAPRDPDGRGPEAGLISGLLTSRYTFSGLTSPSVLSLRRILAPSETVSSPVPSGHTLSLGVVETPTRGHLHKGKSSLTLPSGPRRRSPAQPEKSHSAARLTQVK